jgi:orotidine-5'-phosphate decarboxylase
MMNLHALGGRAMMMEAGKALAEAYGDSADKPKLIAVTVLTSVDALTLESDLHIHHPLEDYVKMLAVQAEGSGLDGVVASAKEIKDIRSVCGEDFLVVTPGIRPAWSSTDDQKRIKTPADAIRDGASHLVIGRPVSKADDPGEAAARIVAELENDL